MKKQLLILSAIFISMTVLGQKNELKTAEKAIKSNDFATALQAIDQAEGLIANADQKLKAKFYYLKGKALYQNGSNQADILKVGAAFNQLIDFERGIKSFKYTSEVGDLLNKMVADVADMASKDYDVANQSKLPEDYIKSAKGFHTVFVLSPTDTSFLDNAALLYNFGKDYETSKEMYEKLLKLEYTGISTSFIATNKTDGKDITYSDKKSRDLQVKLGIAENPREETKDSRREIVFKNLAQNYVSLENSEKALEIIAVGRAEFPKSYDLLLIEGNIYYKNGKNEKYLEKLDEAIKLDPTNAHIHFNIGTLSMDAGNEEKAKKHLEKAIELKPDFADAYNNLGLLILKQLVPIEKELNENATNFAKFDKIKLEKYDPILKECLPYFEKTYEINPTEDLKNQLNNLYENLGMMDKKIE